VFQDVGTLTKFMAVTFQYRFDLNRLRIFRPVRPWGTIEVLFALLDPKPGSASTILRRNDFTFTAGVQSWLKSGPSPRRSGIRADCPPVPTEEWEAQFLASSPE
jgi:hypothetical protein